MRSVLTFAMVMLFVLTGISSVKAQVWNGGTGYSYYNPNTNQYVQVYGNYANNPYPNQYVNTNACQCNYGCKKAHHRKHYGNAYGVTYQVPSAFVRARSQYSYPVQRPYPLF